MSDTAITITGIWRGYLAGSNRGPIFVRLHQTGSSVKADAVFLDLQFGPFLVPLRGTLDGAECKFRLLEFRGSAPVLPLDGQLTIRFDDEFKTAEGTWATDIGTAGTCKLERTKETMLGWLNRRTGIRVIWFIRRWRSTVYGVLLSIVVSAAITKQADLSALTLILLLLPAPFLFSHHLAGLVATFQRARIKKIGPVEFDQNPPTAEIVALATQQAQENIAFAQLNQFFVLRTKILLAAVAHGNGMAVAEFGQLARSFGVVPENIETTLLSILQTGCAQLNESKVVPTDWGKRYVQRGLLLA